MKEFVCFLITLAVAAAGGLLLQKLRFPAGMIVGAILAVGIFNVFTGCAVMPGWLKTVTKVVTGLFIGMNITTEMVRGLKKLAAPTVLLVVLIMTICIGMGIFLYSFGTLDIITSLLSVAPGGLTDMTLFAMDLGGDAAVVAMLQTIRLLSGFCISIPLIKIFRKKVSHISAVEAEPLPSATENLDSATKKKRMLFSAAAAIIGGAIGWIIGKLADFSVMVLICSMVVCAAVNIKTGKLYMDKKLRKIAQILSGAFVGVSITYTSILVLQTALVPALIICLGFAVINIILALLLHRFCNMDMATALLSSIACGASEMALVAADFDANPTTVAVLQISRMVCTTAFYPFAVTFAAALLQGY